MDRGNLLSPSQLVEVQQVAERGMTTLITIRRRTVTPAVVGSDYGDDDVTYVETTESKTQTVKGWFFSSPTPVQEVDTGSVVTVNTYRLYLPVGTDVSDGDEIIVGSDVYTVSDTTRESTWPALLNVSLRKRE